MVLNEKKNFLWLLEYGILDTLFVMHIYDIMYNACHATVLFEINVSRCEKAQMLSSNLRSS